jgi:hypothetical protein
MRSGNRQSSQNQKRYAQASPVTCPMGMGYMCGMIVAGGTGGRMGQTPQTEQPKPDREHNQSVIGTMRPESHHQADDAQRGGQTDQQPLNRVMRKKSQAN